MLMSSRSFDELGVHGRNGVGSDELDFRRPECGCEGNVLESGNIGELYSYSTPRQLKSSMDSITCPIGINPESDSGIDVSGC